VAICQMALRRWLVVPVVLTVVGSAFQVGAEPADISVGELESIASPAEGEMRQPKLVSQFPNPIPPREPELPKPNIPPPQSEPIEPVRPAPAAPEIRPVIPGTITVDRFEFEGNTAFSAEELEELLKPFTGKPITFAELLRAEAAVTKLYTDAGYINSGAVIPADQTLAPEGAVVKIQIVEGGLAEIKVTGTRRINPNYVRSRLELATQKPLNQFRLLEALQLLQLDPLIANISAELSAGSRPELSWLEVRVKEADSFNVELFADNGRAPSVGSFRRGVRISEGNLLGLGDSLSLEYTNTDGSNAYDARYTVPVNPRNGTVTLSAGLTGTNVIEPPFDRVDITGNSRYYQLSFRQPLIQTPTTELALGLTASRQESETELLGEGFPLSAGADREGRTRISALRFFQDYTQRSRQQVFALRSQFSVGIGAFDATINNNPPDSRFFSWRGQAPEVGEICR
jgi:hemolysin activation/secretion protein